MQTTALRYQVRPMNLGDISQVMEVEQESFPSMWPPTAFKRELQQNRLARYLVAIRRKDAKPRAETEPGALPAHSGLGRFLGELRSMLGGEESELPPPESREELIVGFVGVWLLADEAHVVTVAVRESYRGRGIGELLLIVAVELAREHKQALVTLECRVSNEVALSLYQKYGFQQVGLRRRYYSDNHEDAYVLSADSVTSAAYGATFRQLQQEHRRRSGDYEIQL